jgi:hypothetical protein
MIRKHTLTHALTMVLMTLTLFALLAFPAPAQPPEAPAFVSSDVSQTPSTNIPVLAVAEQRVTTATISNLISSGGTLSAQSLTTTTLAGQTTFSGTQILTPTAVEITSPSQTFSAAGTSFVVLTADENTTGITITGGALWQRLLILSGAGSNTMRFDDATSMSLGADKTLTEAQNDLMELLCLTPDGDEWGLINDADGSN